MMKKKLYIVLFVVFMILGCVITYHTAEVHELHKMRANFKHKKEDIEKIIQENGVGENDENYESFQSYTAAIELLDTEIEELESLL